MPVLLLQPLCMGIGVCAQLANLDLKSFEQDLQRNFVAEVSGYDVARGKGVGKGT